MNSSLFANHFAADRLEDIQTLRGFIFPIE
jgi:hypothetical protein